MESSGGGSPAPVDSGAQTQGGDGQLASTGEESADAAGAPESGGEPYGSHIDVETASLIGDGVADGDAGGDLSDLHAALASLSGDSFAYLDLALDHLTSSSDLFDVPSVDFDQIPGDVTGS